MGLEKTISDCEKAYFKSKAQKIDMVDAFLGPLASLGYLSGSEFLFSTSLFASSAELLLVKVPFIAKYVSKTKDYKSLYFFAVKELMLNASMYGGFVDVIPSYSLRINYMLSKY
jgi:hypothetical protein